MNGRLDGSDTEHKTFLSAQKQSDEFVGTEPEEVVAWRYQIHERNIWNATRNQQQIPSPSGWWGVLCQKAREIVALAKRHFEEARSNREQSRAIESSRGSGVSPTWSLKPRSRIEKPDRW